jgi:hypothetical protein
VPAGDGHLVAPGGPLERALRPYQAHEGVQVHRHRRLLLTQLVITILCPHCAQRLPVPTRAAVRSRASPRGP